LGPENAGCDEWAVGYTVKKDYWGNGYACEMIGALIDFARSLGVKIIIAPIAQENRASIKVIKKFGFHIEGESSFKKSGTKTVLLSYIFKLRLH